MTQPIDASDVVKRPIRVLWLTKGLGPGGAERLLVEQAACTTNARLSYRAAFLLPWKQHLVEELADYGVPATCLNVNSEADPRWIRRLWRILRDESIDVLHIHSPLAASIARPLVSIGSRIPIVYTEHNRWPSYNALTRAANHATFRLNDKVFAVSSDVAASVAPRLRNRVEVLVHGIDLARVRALAAERAAVRDELGVAAGQDLVVTVGNLRVAKAYPDLMEAAELALQRSPDLRFVAVGQGQLEAELHALHARMGLRDAFRFLGYQPNAARIIAAADLFVLASHHEGLPVAVMEATALGVPIVATAVGGLREAVVDRRNGLLVPPGRPADLARAMLDALRAPLRDELKAGARTSGDAYSSAVSTRRIEAEYVRLLRTS